MGSRSHSIQRNGYNHIHLTVRDLSRVLVHKDEGWLENMNANSMPFDSTAILSYPLEMVINIDEFLVAQSVKI